LAGISAKHFFESRRLLQKNNARIIEPAVVNVPGFVLKKNFPAHNGFRSEEAQKTELCDATESDARVFVQRLEPSGGDAMVNMAVVSQREPNVDVREKE